MKLLTIVIPSYNVEASLEDTVTSMLEKTIMDKMEIIIVNDGSKDSTKKIGEKLAAKYPNTVRLISKENGGHGSTINTGISEAKGKYFKIVDGDDWVITESLVNLIKELEEIDTDLIYNPYYTVNEKSGERVLISGLKDKICTNTVYNFDNISDSITIPMHTMTIKTKILKENNIYIDEHRFYVDSEYVLFPIPYITDIIFYENPLYLYRIASEQQSMNIKNMQKNIEHHYDVVMKILDFYLKNKNTISYAKQVYLEKYIIGLIEMHYKILFSFKYSLSILNLIRTFDSNLNNKSSEIYSKVNGKSIKLIRKNFTLFYPLICLKEKI